MNKQESIDRQVAALLRAEEAAKHGLSPQPKVWIKIAEGWDNLTYRLADAEEMAARIAKNAEKLAELEKGDADVEVQPSAG